MNRSVWLEEDAPLAGALSSFDDEDADEEDWDDEDDEDWDEDDWDEEEDEEDWDDDDDDLLSRRRRGRPDWD